VVHLDARRGAERARRWQKIAEEAARQSGRSSIPAVSPPLALLEAARATPSEACRIVLHVGDDLAAKAVPLGQVLDGAAAPSGVVLAVGPEGGLTADEVQTLSALGFHVARFGPRVLRAETAAIAAIVAAGLIVGDLRGADGG
jgi:16S rRNA (uracil1498-N3)-methyltransferase